MKKYQTFTFNLPSPQYRQFLTFIARDEKTSPGKVLCKFLHCQAWKVIDKQASEKTHKELAMEFANEFDFETVSWLLGSCTSHWQKLSRTIGQEKAIAYQEKFLPLWDKYTHEIDKAAGLDYFNLERRYELTDTE
jgi:hypothetical protein